jgi:hypothetical protein
MSGRQKGRRQKKEFYYFESEAEKFEKFRFYLNLINMMTRTKYKNIYLYSNKKNNISKIILKKIILGNLIPS